MSTYTNFIETKKLPYSHYIGFVTDMNLDGFCLNGNIYCKNFPNDLKISILFDMDDMTYNIITEQNGKCLTWDWTPDIEHVIRLIVKHIEAVYTKWIKET